MGTPNEMPQVLQEFAQTMKRDWDERARANAKWFINTFKLMQSDDEFDTTGRRDVQAAIIDKLEQLTGGRDPQQLRFLEIGCGIGRMTKFLAEVFAEVHATDVSAAMIEQARQRLNGLSNVHLYETSGVNFTELPNDYFDVVFSIHVFQHVPDAAVIRSNLEDAYRVLKPGGLMRFQTSSIVTFDYEELEKDTWVGASFPETELRRFAAEVNAQLISILGAGTQYCWTTLRKRASAPVQYATAAPRIVAAGRADDLRIKKVPTGGDFAHLGLVVSGLAPEAIDANSVSVVIGDLEIWPQYVGPTGFGALLRDEFGDAVEQMIQINQHLPIGLPEGPAPVRVRVRDGQFSEPVTAEFEKPQPIIPKIMAVKNDYDEWTDVCERSRQTVLKVFAEGLDQTADTGNIRVQIGQRIIKPDYIEFVAGNGWYLVNTPLPRDLAPGDAELSLYFGNLHSPGRMLHIK